jgi:hypothetical protein
MGQLEQSLEGFAFLNDERSAALFSPSCRDSRASAESGVCAWFNLEVRLIGYCTDFG